jgi:hypothetical protein
MFTRRGAVHELESRLASEDLPVAAGAYQALAELARTDIQYLANLAAAALSQAAVRPEETELHFGEQRQGSDPPHRTVRLLGLPIARACAPRASHDWIHFNETPEGFDISVDTTSTGILRGSIDLKGPTGTAVIAIDVELLPQPHAAQPQAAEPHDNHAPAARESSTTSSAQTPARAAPAGATTQHPADQARAASAADGEISASVPAAVKQSPKDVPVKVEVREGLGEFLHAVPVAVAELTRPMRDVDPSFLRDYQSARKVSQHSYFLTHILGPAKRARQKYSVEIRVTAHKEATHQVKSATFYLGRSWGNNVFVGVRGPDGRFGMATEAYGPFLALCDVEFDDSSRILLDHYCDFEMGSLLPS